MAITYGRNLVRTGQGLLLGGKMLMKAYTTHTEKSDAFVSYQHSDQDTALELASYLDRLGKHVFIDVHDDALSPGDQDLDYALLTAVTSADTMLIVVSDHTQGSWWVPWEIGVSTPLGKPKALFKPTASKPLPTYLQKLERLKDPAIAHLWVIKQQIRKLKS